MMNKDNNTFMKIYSVKLTFEDWKAEGCWYGSGIVVAKDSRTAEEMVTFSLTKRYDYLGAVTESEVEPMLTTDQGFVFDLNIKRG